MEKILQSTVTLNDGAKMPYLGLGTWQSNGRNCEHAVEFALNHGYNLIDTAQLYFNEKCVGKAWKNNGRRRETIFITTKIGDPNQGYKRSIQSLKKSLKNLGTEYVDLLLIHWPNTHHFGRTIETWRALVEQRENGLCRSIGVCNFTIPLIERLVNEIDVIPSVNQVEFHTFLYQKELLKGCQDKRIQLQAYSPIARAKFLDNDKIQQIAKKHDKSPAQVMIAWCIQHGVPVVPKTIHENRILENADVFFELDKVDMKTLDNFEQQVRLIKGISSPPSW